jgi:hypothetical protein
LGFGKKLFICKRKWVKLSKPMELRVMRWLRILTLRIARKA